MTGLNPDESVILEVAAVVTDLGLTQLDRYQAVVRQPETVLTAMNEWNIKTHTQSGLLDRVPYGKPLQQVEEEVVAIVREHFPDEPAVLAGNSVHQDKRFIERYMKKLASMLHYRLLDVSAFKLVFRHMLHVEYNKQNNHRAIDDIFESIQELQHYLGYIEVSRKGAV